MRKTIHRLTAAMAAAVLMLVTAAAPAPAAPGGYKSYKWLTCATGTSTSAVIEQITTQEEWVKLTVRFNTCAVPAGNDVFAFAHYDVNGAASGKAATYLGGVEMVFPSVEPTIQLTTNMQAVCVVSGPDTRLQCLSVTTYVDGNGVTRPALGTPIPVDHPLVNARVATTLLESTWVGQGPGCSVCWPWPTPY